LLGRGDGSGGRWAARVVPILHAFLEKVIARLALQSLLVRTEVASRHFLLRIDCKTRPRWQEHNQSGSQKRGTTHAESPYLEKHLIIAKAWPLVRVKRAPCSGSTEHFVWRVFVFAGLLRASRTYRRL
jgi:hypothetical protein